MHTRRLPQAPLGPFLLSVCLCCATGIVWTLPALATDLSNGLSDSITRTASAETEETAAIAAPPQKTYDLLKLLQERGGEPLPGYIGGREFQNRERRLPRGRYREYDVNPKVRGRSRDAERIVIEQRTRKAYYTGDHYRTFTPLN